MGKYLNPSSMNFKEDRNSKIYIDKSELIAYTNDCLGTRNKLLCISRPRRFGKTMVTDMLAAYYGCKEQTDTLFDGLKIQTHETYKQHLNQYNVIKVDMQSFLTKTPSTTVDEMVIYFISDIVYELTEVYPDVTFRNPTDFSDVLTRVFLATGKQFVFLIDEWDCVMRRIHDWPQQKIYLDFLRNFLKDQPYIALAYMTGILPVKKYGEHSTLNMFDGNKTQLHPVRKKPMITSLPFTTMENRHSLYHRTGALLRAGVLYDYP